MTRKRLATLAAAVALAIPAFAACADDTTDVPDDGGIEEVPGS